MKEEAKKKFTQTERGVIDFQNGNKIVISVIVNPKYPQKHIDIRHHIESPKYTGPTRKGLRIPSEHLPYFANLMNELLEETTSNE